jgi:hypothetical protein
MEVTISLPEQVFANLSSIATKSHRRIDEIIVEKIERDFTIDAKELENQIAICSDNEVVTLADISLPAKQDERLSELLTKQNEAQLSAAEQKEMWQLMEANRVATLKKAYALREISRRGLNGKD